MSSLKYKDLVNPTEEKKKPYIMTQVDTTYGGNGLAPVYTSAGNGGGVAAGAAVGGVAAGGNASDVVDDTYAGNGAIPGGGATDGGDVSSTVPPVAENGGDSAPSAIQPVDSYASFAAYYEKMKQNEMAAAEAMRKKTYENAEAARERATIDANTSYQKNLSNYGAKAEHLSEEGLTGSGYGEYLDAQAYAAMRGEVQAARAQEFAAKQNADYIEGQAKLDADNSYQANMLELEKAKKTEAAQKQSTYQTVLGNAHSGVYATVDAAKDAAAIAGLDETQKAAIVNATQKYIDRLQYANNEEVALALGDEVGVIQNKVLGGKLSEEQGQQQIYNILSEQYENAIVNGAEFDASEADALTGEWKEKFKELYNKRYETSDKLFLKSEGGYTIEGEYVTEAEAESILAKALDDKLLDEPAKKAIQKSFDYRYGAQVGMAASKNSLYGYNRNETIYAEFGDVKIPLKIDFNSPSNDYIQEKAKNVGAVDNGQIFAVGQYAYIMMGGKAYPISKGKDEAAYKKLVAYIKKANGLTGG